MTVLVLCRALLNYAPPAGSWEDALSAIEVEIRDGRAQPLPGWRECGFELVSYASQVSDWTDDDEIAEVHYGEVEALAREMTGCDVALVSDHVRRAGQEPRGARDQAPVRLVHSDFAANYEDVIRHAYRDVRGRGARTLVRNGVSADVVSAARRIVMMQFWRNTGPAKMDLPLAFCDARTVTPADARPFPYTGYVAGGRSFDALAITTPDDPDAHAWYTFPGMKPHEVVAFRTYDTDLVRAGRTWFTPHSAFRDPDVDLGAPARSSVELRVACLFGT